jgi:hypothetical protein
VLFPEIQIPMPATIEHEDGDIYVLRVSGTWKPSELNACQEQLAKKIDAGARPRLLTILEDFEGWERKAEWDDIDFLFSHSHEIRKIGIVGEPRWEANALVFAGAGVRKAPVKFFPPDELTLARAWLAV